jgi:hypothetical protein
LNKAHSPLGPYSDFRRRNHAVCVELSIWNSIFARLLSRMLDDELQLFSSHATPLGISPTFASVSVSSHFIVPFPRTCSAEM